VGTVALHELKKEIHETRGIPGFQLLKKLMEVPGINLFTRVYQRIHRFEGYLLQGVKRLIKALVSGIRWLNPLLIRIPSIHIHLYTCS
jgi:hypothetical protein